MNKQKKGAGIEWTQPYGRNGYTWNPIAGCFHDCKWTMPDGTIAGCYAKSVAENVARSAYPNGFEHHYWNPHRLNEPLKVSQPSGIFLDSMSDLMGHWVTDEQIESVLDVCRQADHHIFFLLTKNAPRLSKFTYPNNVWVGASSPPDFYMGKELSNHQKDKMMKTTLKTLQEVEATVTWVSFEPLSRDYSHHLAVYPNAINWAVIGAASQGRNYYPPNVIDFMHMMDVLDKQKIPVFFKGNLKSLHNAVADWREDYPILKLETSTTTQLGLF